jgi:hypothetical protein
VLSGGILANAELCVPLALWFSGLHPFVPGQKKKNKALKNAFFPEAYSDFLVFAKASAHELTKKKLCLTRNTQRASVRTPPGIDAFFAASPKVSFFGGTQRFSFLSLDKK